MCTYGPLENNKYRPTVPTSLLAARHGNMSGAAIDGGAGESWAGASWAGGADRTLSGWDRNHSLMLHTVGNSHTMYCTLHNYQRVSYRFCSENSVSDLIMDVPYNALKCLCRSTQY